MELNDLGETPDPVDIEKQLHQVLGRAVSSLYEEAATLEEAHALLHAALQ